MPESSKSSQHYKKKINFWSLFEKFKLKVIKHFLVTAVWTAILSVTYVIINNFVEKKVEDNYTLLLPDKLQKYFPALSKEKFILFGLTLVCLFALSDYLTSLWEGELRVRGGYYVKNCLLDKFRQLPLAEKQTKVKEINTLAEFDSNEIGYTWEHLPNHFYHSILTIILLLWMRWENFRIMDGKEISFSIFWLALISLVSYYFTRLVIKNEKRYKKELTKEWNIISQENDKSILIDSMGLASQYRTKQREISRKNENMLLSFNYVKAINKTVPNQWLAEMFPYLLLLISWGFGIAQKNLLPMWWIFDNFRSIFKCFWDYGEYTVSLNRVNNFLSLPNKNDNLEGIKLGSELSIQSIQLHQVSFQYPSQEKNCLKNQSLTFMAGKVNYLTWPNGTGKSTLLYLILGILYPQQGKIIVCLQNETSYNLQQLNLVSWRENNIAFISHENLIEKGSTGQKQWQNLENILSQKASAQVWLFDEADNALDPTNQALLKQKLTDLAKDRVVVYISHQA
jgi:ABC-type bacteriocin/lantibiotic exporter with double-glycine peptidase domain